MQQSLSLILLLRKTSECRNYNPWRRRKGKRRGRGEKMSFSLPAPWVAGQTTNKPWLILMIEPLFDNVKFLYFVMQSCDTANVMASPCQPGSASSCDQRKRRWCPRNANVTANDQYRQKVTMTWYDITAYKSRGIHVMWWLSTTRKATKETSADWSVAKGIVYVAYEPLHVSKRFTWCTVYTCWLIRLYSGELTQPRVHDDDDGNDRFYEQNNNYAGA